MQESLYCFVLCEIINKRQGMKRSKCLTTDNGYRTGSTFIPQSIIKHFKGEMLIIYNYMNGI